MVLTYREKQWLAAQVKMAVTNTGQDCSVCVPSRTANRIGKPCLCCFLAKVVPYTSGKIAAYGVWAHSCKMLSKHIQPSCTLAAKEYFPAAPLLCFGVCRSVLTPGCHLGQTSVCQRSNTPISWSGKPKANAWSHFQFLSVVVTLLCSNMHGLLRSNSGPLCH